MSDTLRDLLTSSAEEIELDPFPAAELATRTRTAVRRRHRRRIALAASTAVAAAAASWFAVPRGDEVAEFTDPNGSGLSDQQVAWARAIVEDQADGHEVFAATVELVPGRVRQSNTGTSAARASCCGWRCAWSTRPSA